MTIDNLPSFIQVIEKNKCACGRIVDSIKGYDLKIEVFDIYDSRNIQIRKYRMYYK